eukprot:2096525-Pleurochrysis_carterae.AAC.1
MSVTISLSAAAQSSNHLAKRIVKGARTPDISVGGKQRWNSSDCPMLRADPILNPYVAALYVRCGCVGRVEEVELIPFVSDKISHDQTAHTRARATLVSPGGNRRHGGSPCRPTRR